MNVYDQTWITAFARTSMHTNEHVVVRQVMRDGVDDQHDEVTVAVQEQGGRQICNLHLHADASRAQRWCAMTQHQWQSQAYNDQDGPLHPHTFLVSMGFSEHARSALTWPQLASWPSIST